MLSNGNGSNPSLYAGGLSEERRGKVARVVLGSYKQGLYSVDLLLNNNGGSSSQGFKSTEALHSKVD
jgi:hypothetical protein